MVCKNIVNFFKGNLSVDSEFGNGSKFSFSFLVKVYEMNYDSDKGSNINSKRKKSILSNGSEV